MAAEPLIPIPESLAHDPLVYNAIRDLTIAAIRQATEMLDTVALPHRIQLIRAILPAASRALSAKTNDAEDDELRAEMKALYEQLTKAIGSDEVAS